MIKTSSVTIRDIAELAGLSPSTVSAVLNGRKVERRISEESAQKVLKASRALGYVPNIAARSLRNASFENRRVVVAILTSIEAPIRLVSDTLRAVEEAVNPREPNGMTFSVSIEVFRAGRLKKLPGFIEGRRFNGAVVTNTAVADDRFLAGVKLPFPVVLLGRSIPGYPSVSEKPGDPGKEAAEVLRAAGRKDLAILCPRMPTQATQGRLSAFTESVLRNTGRAPDKIVCPAVSAEAAYEAVRGYLAEGGPCDGMFAVTDGLATGAYHAIKKDGRAIPSDIAVVGAGDQDAGAFLDPPLTSFSNARDTMNRKAAAILLRMLQGEEVEAVNFEVPTIGRLRESTGHRSE